MNLIFAQKQTRDFKIKVHVKELHKNINCKMLYTHKPIIINIIIIIGL